MSHDQLRGAIEAIRTQLQTELEAQLAAVERQQAEAVEAARREVREEADARWKAELDRVRAEWESRFHGELAEAGAAAERRLVAETTRVRIEAEQQASELAERARQETAKTEDARAALEHSLGAERAARSVAEETAATHAARVTELEREFEEARRRAVTLEHDLATLRARQEQDAAAARERLQAEADRVRDLTEELSDVRQSGEDRVRRSVEEFSVLRDSLQAELGAAQAELQRVRQLHDTELGTVRAELERVQQSHQTELAAAREELQRERQSLDAERAATQRAIDDEHSAARRAIEAEAQKAHTAEQLRAAERQSQLAGTERLLGAVRAISEARSLADVMAALANGAAAEASRAVVLVPGGGGLHAFKASGFHPDDVRHRPADERDLLHAAMRNRTPVAVTPGTAPPFAKLIEDRAGLVVPIVIGGQAVAVLYADNGMAADPEVPASWPEAVQILCHHACAALAHLTAVRTTQAMRLMRPARSGAAPGPNPQAPDSDEDLAARRYARLLVSEIKLYNESAVRVGREKRDLLTRLRPEIDRARRLYEERVPPTVAARDEYFAHELRETLAGGDPSLLGEQVVSP